MAGDRGLQPPLLYRALLHAAGRIVPRRGRPEWRNHRLAVLQNWWVLVERGELPAHTGAQFAAICRGAFADAFWTRFSREGLRDFLHGPAALIALAMSLAAFGAVASSGFAGTRRLLGAGLGEHMVPHAILTGFGLVIGGIIIAVRYRPLRWRGAPYWAFLAFKAAVVAILIPVLWVEGLAILTGWLPRREGSMALKALGSLFLYVPLLACALGWAFTDQMRRCPVCLKLLAMPVRIGSWSSVLEPATTELLCEDGHGTLCVHETDPTAPDRWTTLDESWRDLFEVESRSR